MATMFSRGALEIGDVVDGLDGVCVVTPGRLPRNFTEIIVTSQLTSATPLPLAPRAPMVPATCVA